MLNAAQRERIADEMAFMILGNPYALVPLMGRRHAIRIASDPVPRTYALRALMYCERSAWVETPPLLVNVLQQLTPVDAFFAAVLAEVQGWMPQIFHVDGAPWDTCQVALEMPFLNRELSRRAIREFTAPLLQPGAAAPVNPSPARVLVVNGASGSGKTFTLDYVRYLAMVNGNIHGVAYVDAVKQVGARFGPDDLARSLAAQIDPLAGNLPLPGTQRADRWILELTRWLVEVAIRSQKEFWYLVLDNFDDPRVPEDTHALIQLLVTGLGGKDPISWEIIDRDAGPQLRLLLLRYNRPLAIESDPRSRVDGRICREEVQPVGRDDVREHFRRYFAYRQWPANAAALDQVVARLWEALAKVPPALAEAPVRSRTLAQLVRTMSSELERLRDRSGGGGGA